MVRGTHSPTHSPNRDIEEGPHLEDHRFQGTEFGQLCATEHSCCHPAGQRTPSDARGGTHLLCQVSEVLLLEEAELVLRALLQELCLAFALGPGLSGLGLQGGRSRGTRW